MTVGIFVAMYYKIAELFFEKGPWGIVIGIVLILISPAVIALICALIINIKEKWKRFFGKNSKKW